MVSSVAYKVAPQTKEQRLSKGAEGDPAFVTPSTIDPLFEFPVVDNEYDTTEPTQLHVLSGHFKDTSTTFNFYLPPKETWQNRFFQYAYPLQPAEALPADILFGASSGGYTVQCKGQIGYRHEAATAKFSREVASKYYGVEPTSIYGYIYGGSGGAYVSIAALENSEGIWQGGVPFVVPSTMSIPDSQSTLSMGALVLAGHIPEIADAVAPGGSGNPTKSLLPWEAAVFDEVTRLGIPTRGWEALDYDAENCRRLLLFYPYIRDLDPTYLHDFWNTDGYLGSEKSELGDFFRAHRYTGTTEIKDVEINAEGHVVSFKVPGVSSDQNLRGVDVEVVTGETVTKITGSLDSKSKTYTVENATPVLKDVFGPSSTLRYDNSLFIACHAYHRYHQPSRSGYTAWNQYLDVDGKPMYPQRPLETGPFFSVRTCGGGTHTGKFEAKVIVLGNLLDVDAYPWYSDWYTAQVRAGLGPESFEDQYRLYFNDNADHYNGAVTKDEFKGKQFQYDGIYYQALNYVADWAERGIAPPPSTTYEMDQNTQVVVPILAKDRAGIQPTVQTTVNGAERADIVLGATVVFEAEIEVPAGAGVIVRADWDFEGVGDYKHSQSVPAGVTSLKVKTTHTYSEPGTYFPVIRVSSQRKGESSVACGLVDNLGRNRVVVMVGSKSRSEVVYE